MMGSDTDTRRLWCDGHTAAADALERHAALAIAAMGLALTCLMGLPWAGAIYGHRLRCLRPTSMRRLPIQRTGFSCVMLALGLVGAGTGAGLAIAIYPCWVC